VKTYEVRNDGLLVGFEIHAWIGRWRASRIARDIPGSVIIRWPDRNDYDEFCEFEVDGERYLIIERFGDDHRFWIVSDPPAPEIAVHKVQTHFRRARAFDWKWRKG
jgi:hypothetical protein